MPDSRPVSRQRDELLTDLRERINRFGADNNPATILSDETRDVADQLQEAVSPSFDFDVLQALGWFHWARYLALPEGQDQADLSIALQLLELVYYTDPDSVPDDVRRHFDRTSPGLTQARALFEAGSQGLQQALSTRDPAAVDAAADLLGRALDGIPRGHPDWAMCSSNLAAAFGTRFERTGNLADLDRAIDVGEQAVDATPPGHPNRAGYLTNLGSALGIRFERTGNPADLDRAIDVGEQAVDATPPGHPSQAGRLSMLARFLQARYDRTGDLADLDRAIEIGERTVAAGPSQTHPGRADSERYP
jgi:hypothetical protein